MINKFTFPFEYSLIQVITVIYNKPFSETLNYLYNFILKHKLADINQRNCYGNTILHILLRNYSKDQFFSYINEGADPNIPNSFTKRTPTHFIFSVLNNEDIQKLIHKLDLSVISLYNETIYYYASLNKGNILLYLLDNVHYDIDSLYQLTTYGKSIFSFNVNVKVDDIICKLHIVDNLNYIISNGQTLITHLCQCDTGINLGRYILYYLFNNNNELLVKLLERKDNKQKPPIFYLKSISLYELALKFGVNANITNNNGINKLFN